jgi:hypothetical protein
MSVRLQEARKAVRRQLSQMMLPDRPELGGGRDDAS